MRGKAVEVVPSAEEREFLEAHVRRHKAPRSLSDRCRIIMLCAEGLRSREVAERTGVHEHTVGKWRKRFAERRIEGLSDECRSGRPRTVTDDKAAEAGGRTLSTMPKDATHWSVRSMAERTGASHATVHRIRSAFSLKPHRSGTFKSVDGPAVRRGAGHRGALHGPAGPRVELHASSKGWQEDRGRGGRRAARAAAAARRPGPHDHGGQRQGVRGPRLGGAGARGRVLLRDAVPFLGAGPERAHERPVAGMLFQGHRLGKVTDAEVKAVQDRTDARPRKHPCFGSRPDSAFFGDPCPGFPHPVHSPVRIRATVREGGNPPVAGTRPVH